MATKQITLGGEKLEEWEQEVAVEGGRKEEGGEKPLLEVTTLWDYPKQSYGKTSKGDNKYPGVTPAFVIYNLIQRYTKPYDLVVDPMAGSGTRCLQRGK